MGDAMVWATYDVNGDAYFWEVEVLTPGMPPIVKTPAKGGTSKMVIFAGKRTGEEKRH
jgi:hypothetical protein